MVKNGEPKVIYWAAGTNDYEIISKKQREYGGKIYRAYIVTKSWLPQHYQGYVLVKGKFDEPRASTNEVDIIIRDGPIESLYEANNVMKKIRARAQHGQIKRVLFIGDSRINTNIQVPFTIEHGALVIYDYSEYGLSAGKNATSSEYLLTLLKSLPKDMKVEAIGLSERWLKEHNIKTVQDAINEIKVYK